VRHRVVGAHWPPTEQLVADEESLTACWAWEQFYLGMTIAGTIYNELRLPTGRTAEASEPGPPVPDPPQRASRRWLRSRTAAAWPRVRQHEPSGGGRSIPQRRRARHVLTGYRKRPPEGPEEGRLGGRAWGLGRGAAPPKFPPRRDG
jgi:hypothetical protein